MGADTDLLEFKRRVTSQYPDASVYTFGSRARGDNLKSSDYDILFIAEAFQDTNSVRRREALYQYWDGDEHADIITYTPAEFGGRFSKITVARAAKKDKLEI